MNPGRRVVELRERRFVQSVLKTPKLPDAYAAAGYKTKTREAASASGSRMLARPRVQKMLARALADVQEEDIVGQIAQNALDEKPSDEFKQDHKLQYIKLLAKLKGLLKEDDGNPKSVTNNIIN